MRRALCVLAMAVACCLTCLGIVSACYEIPCDIGDGQYLNSDNEDLLVFDCWNNDERPGGQYAGYCSPQDLILARSTSFSSAELDFYRRSLSWATIILPWGRGGEAFSFVPRHTLSDYQHIMDCGLGYNGYAMNKRFWFCNNHDDHNNDGADDAGCPLPVPEPGSMLLLGTGLVGLAGCRFRKE